MLGRVGSAVAGVLLSISAALYAQQTEIHPERLEPNPAASMPTPPRAIEAGRVRIEILGEQEFPERELREAFAEQIEAIDEQGLSAALADDTAFFLTLFYRKQGYSQVEVAWNIVSPRFLRLTVREGPLTKLTDVRFSGVSQLPEETLRDYIIGTTRERFPRLRRELPFVESDVQTGVERIRGLYLAEGFLHAEVESPEITFSRDKTEASVHVAVKEGIRYTFGKVDLTGDIVFFPNTELLKQLDPFLKKPYTPQQVTNMQRAVVYFYKSRGYYKAEAEVTADPATAVNGVVPVTFHVDSGSVYRFNGITVKGLDRLSEKFLPNRFSSLRGKFYNPAVLDEKFREMMRTGLFSQLRIDTEANDETHEIIMNLNVEEARAKELGFSAGYGTYEGAFVGLHAADRNLFGTGRPIISNLEYSTRYMKGEVSYSDPWFLESDYALRMRLYALTYKFEGYSKFEVGFRPEISRKLAKNLEVGLFALPRHVKVTEEGIDPLELGPPSYFVNSLGASVTLDTRDSAMNPRRGFVANASADFASGALGSDLEFLRTTTRFSYYLPIKKTLLAFGIRGGIIHPFEQERDALPIDERFFNGGSRSVRSFEERELGPKDRHGYPVGGEVFTTFNIEYDFPIVGNFLGAVFVDAGSVSREIGFGEMRYGIGTGVRYRLPIGALRLDYGVNPSPKDEEAIGAFHFSFGFAF